MLKLTAKMENRNARLGLATMSVRVNGRSSGRLCTKAEDADELVALLNAVTELRDALGEMVSGAHVCDLRGVLLDYILMEVPGSVWGAACAANAKAKGTT